MVEWKSATPHTKGAWKVYGTKLHGYMLSLLD